MTRSKILSIFVLCLFALNVFLISNAYLSKSRSYTNAKNPRIGSKRQIMEDLDFDQKQIELFTVYIHRYKKVISPKDTEYKALKKILYQILMTGDYSNKDILLTKMGKLQEEIEDLRFKQMLDIKSICRKDQIPKFETLINTLLSNRPVNSNDSE